MFPDEPRTEEGKNAKVGVGHDGQILAVLEKRKWKETMRQEEQVIDLAADPSGKIEGWIFLEQRLKPGAVVEHCEELKV